MFLHFGKKRIDESKGFVADFCPICRRIQPFQLFEAKIKKTFNTIAYGKGESLGLFVQCTECGLRVPRDDMPYAEAQKAPGISVEVLVEQTFPDLRTVLRERLALEEKLRRNLDSLTTGEREALLMEPFEALSPMVEDQFRADSTTMDTKSSLGCLGTALVVGGLFFVSVIAFHGKAQDRGLLAVLVLGLLGTAYCLWQIHHVPHRFLSNKIQPLACRALKPLSPTRDEISACLQKCQNEGLFAGKEIKLNPMWQALQ